MNQSQNKKYYDGVVTSKKMDKTCIVTIKKTMKHKRYEKVITRNTKFYVHDELNTAVVGDKVTIVETRPISKTKKFRIAKNKKREV